MTPVAHAADLWSALVFLVPAVVFVIWLLVQRSRAQRRQAWESAQEGDARGDHSPPER